MLVRMRVFRWVSSFVAWPKLSRATPVIMEIHLAFLSFVIYVVPTTQPTFFVAPLGRENMAQKATFYARSFVYNEASFRQLFPSFASSYGILFAWILALSLFLRWDIKLRSGLEIFPSRDFVVPCVPSIGHWIALVLLYSRGRFSLHLLFGNKKRDETRKLATTIFSLHEKLLCCNFSRPGNWVWFLWKAEEGKKIESKNSNWVQTMTEWNKKNLDG